MENEACSLDEKLTLFRIFSRLDIKGENVIKGIQLDGLRKIGSPKLLAAKYLENGADELVLVDVVASLYNRSNLSSLITEIANELRIPMTALGGVRTLSDAQTVFNSGADKVGINSAGLVNPTLLTKIANLYGSQAVVTSIEAKRSPQPNSWLCMTENGRHNSGKEVREWVSELESLGVGEIFVTSVDQDGTSRGPDFALCEMIRENSELPIIYSGGIRNADDVLKIAKLGLDGVAIGAALHYKKVDIEEIKECLHQNGISIRPSKAIA